MAEREIAHRGARPRRRRGRHARPRARRPGRGRRAAHLRAAALLRGVPARAALRRGPRHHRAHLRHLPGRLPDELDRGDGGRLRRRGPRAGRAPCAGCSTAASGSRATRCMSSCCTRRTSSATRSAFEMAGDHRGVVEWALALKKAGNALMRVIGGREIHPINVRVGGFYRAPTRAELAPVVEQLERAREFAREAVAWTAGAAVPGLRGGLRLRRAARPRRLRGSSRGRLVSSTGPGPRARGVRRARRRGAGAALHGAALAPASTATRYLVGPLARYALNRDRAVTRLRARRPTRPGLEAVCRNPFRSIVVRAVEILYALDEALRLLDAYEPPDPPAVEVVPRAGVGLRLDRGAARAALAPLRDRRRGHDPRRPHRAADLAEPGPHRAEPARVRRSATSISTTTSCAFAASRRCAATTRASPARRTSCASRSTASVILIGVGNAWRGDDAAGLAVARRVRALAPTGSTCASTRATPTALIDAWAGAEHVVVVDAAESGGGAGHHPPLRRRRRRRCPCAPCARRRTPSASRTPIELARALGRLPGRLDVYAIEGASFAAGSP